MNEQAWRELLTRWNADLLRTPSELEDVPADIVASGWLGRPGATELQIQAAEARLGRSLPPSYRAFLKVSNGWDTLGGFHGNMWSTEEVDWFRVRNQDWIDAYVCHLDPDEWEGPNSVPDSEYFNYGTPPDGQGQGKPRIEYLPAMLEISDIGDADILLLNPEIISADGEWEAWEFATWQPVPSRYRSFREMMQNLHRSFLDRKAYCGR